MPTAMATGPGHPPEPTRPLEGQAADFMESRVSGPLPAVGGKVSVAVSPQLRAEVKWLHRVLRESLMGQAPRDAAYQDAVAQGREIKPGLATRQFRAVLNPTEAP